MADRRRRRKATSDEESEEISSDSDHANEAKLVEKATEEPSCKTKEIETVEPEFHSAEEDNAKEAEQKASSEKLVQKVSEGYEENGSQTELIDEDGGGEGIAEAEEVEGEFLDGELFDATEENEKECIKEEIEQAGHDKKAFTEDKEADAKEVCTKEKEFCDDKAVVAVNKEVTCLDNEEDNVGKEIYADEGCLEKNVDLSREECADEEDEEDYGEEEECDDEEEEGAEGEDECDDEEDDECVKEEREQGDGEECSPGAADKELDFDEDRRNPQYIPKKGIFYEHDDRNAAETPKETEVDLTRDKKKKKLWLDDDKWGHDRYKEDEQTPKSKNELIEAYGYDIRCEDCPPRARRRRRYGRGPTKYEPNWNEEGPGKERTLGMFIKRGTRGGRPRGRFRGGNNNSFRGTGRPYNKSENDDSFNRNSNNDGERPNARRGSFTPKSPKETNFCNWKSDDLPLSGSNKQMKGEDLCGWPSEKTPVANVVIQRKEEPECGWELNNEPVAVQKVKQTKAENLCGWESDEAEPVAQPVKQTKDENLPGWECNDKNNAPVTHTVKQTKSENLNRWGNNKTAVPHIVKQLKEENTCGWETDESPVEEEPPPVPMNSKEFPALPTKEVITKPLPVDRNSAFTKRKPIIPNTEPLQTNSVRTQTFENSTFSNRPPQSYEKPSRHEGRGSTFRSTTRGGGNFRRTSRGRPPRGGDRYNNNGGGDTFSKPTVGPRLLEKQANRNNSDYDRMNLNNKNDSYDNVEDLASYEEKRNLKKQNLVTFSKTEDSANRPKRYSSSRHRPMPETTMYQPASVPPHTPYYHPSYQATLYAASDAAVAPATQPPSSASPPVINPPQYPTYAPPPHYAESYNLRMAVNNAPRIFSQVPAGQPIMTPPPCINPNPTMLNYPPPSTAPTAYPPPPPQFTYQQFSTPPPQPPPPVSQTPDIYQSGITYYYPQPQLGTTPQVRQVPQKRPKAAIPIVPPPESTTKSCERDHATQLEDVQCPDVDSAVDSTDSSTMQTHAPIEVES